MSYCHVSSLRKLAQCSSDLASLARESLYHTLVIGKGSIESVDIEDYSLSTTTYVRNMVKFHKRHKDCSSWRSMVRRAYVLESDDYTENEHRDAIVLALTKAERIRHFH